MTQVFIIHIDLTLTVGMVTENGQIKAKIEKRLFWTQFGGFIDSIFKN